ncbi:hypothetical protein UY3_09837 [Chelonia mydas]|uniref:Myb/SANT-like DNA-binding domain-containing protein n=1 Tax=Chelonia mydas TaxID=8469 RepID=M7B7B3_CHEMY|nr:hypothetical protein UY3_09837 [Chelonia mydas]
MLAPCCRHAPAWSTQEVMALLGLWGEKDVHAQLPSSCRNVNIYKHIMLGMEEKGYKRVPQQCHVKVKELWQANQKAREANSCSDAELQTCCFYKELHHPWR